MKYITSFNEHVGIYGSTAASMGPSAYGNTGMTTGYTGPVAFHARGNISGFAPIISGQIPADTDDLKLPDYTKAKVQQTFVNDMKGKHRKRAEDNLFGKSKRRIDKIKGQLKQSKLSKGKFTDEKDKLDHEQIPPRGNIKNFTDFSEE